MHGWPNNTGNHDSRDEAGGEKEGRAKIEGNGVDKIATLLSSWTAGSQLEVLASAPPPRVRKRWKPKNTRCRAAASWPNRASRRASRAPEREGRLTARTGRRVGD